MHFVSWNMARHNLHKCLAMPAILLLALRISSVGVLAQTTLDGWIIRDGGVIRGPVSEKKIALVFTGDTFAEGGDAILDELARHNAWASFFLTGNFLTNAAFVPLVHRMIAEGEYVGPHSDKHMLFCDWHDPAKTLVTRDEFCADMNANLDKLANLGVSRAEGRFFLPAFEHFNGEIARWSAEMGLTLVNFTPGTRANADYTGEADRNFVASGGIFDSIVRRDRDDTNGLNGFILLMHVGSGPGRTDKFSNRFGALLDYLATHGYQCVRIDELLAASDTVYIRANQVGYGAREPKIAIAFSRAPMPKSFCVADSESEKAVFTGRAKRVRGSGSEWGQFRNHVELDFSSLTNPGSYLIEYGNGVSLPFEINSHALAALPDELLDFMREQRCGYNPWLGTNCHQLDGRTAYGPLPYGTRVDVTGGWHDAGDTLKYLMTSETATADMLLAYEVNTGNNLLTRAAQLGGATSVFIGGNAHSNDSARPAIAGGGDAAAQRLYRAIFADRVDAQGNSGSNGIPDILDEAHWGLEWMLKMHPAPGSLYFQVGDDRDHIGWRLPQNDTANYGWGKGGARVVYFADGRPQGLGKYKSPSTGVANLAGTYAAAMALAYEIWHDDASPSQRQFAEQCLRAGREVYALGRLQEGVQQGNSYSAPYRYAPTIWAQDMEWGAAELYRATGETQFLADAKRYARLAARDNWMGREQTGHYQYYPFLNAGHFRLYDLVDGHFKRRLAGYYRAGIDRCVRAGKKNPYHAGVPFIWCSDNLAAALVTQCRMYERMTGDSRYHEFAAEQRDWLLGRNSWGMTMFSNIGSVYPCNVHLMTHLLGRGVRGALVDGPVYDRIFNSLKGVGVSQPDPLAAFQGAAVYHDDIHDYSSNEPTMDGTAAAILMFALENELNATP